MRSIQILGFKCFSDYIAQLSSISPPIVNFLVPSSPTLWDRITAPPDIYTLCLTHSIHQTTTVTKHDSLLDSRSCLTASSAVIGPNGHP
ncbi:hypothetical protein HO173_002495 [Letharia columbiana]|uniref:Uncharacterized protein n=1 Tax=Letharia columbiana TaxID=112416 RepID=A0A8H6G2G2_9LECA|nr:uncharacterized protein HO173_002495 [Letharia columbiana]KAF6239234.1 hypothetical protein HO173_002495 [Letharia columbiana]